MVINFPLSHLKRRASGVKTLKVYLNLAIISQISSNTHARTQSATYWIRKISITLQTFVSYHIRKSIHSVNPLFQDAHTNNHTSLYSYANATDHLSNSYSSSMP